MCVCTHEEKGEREEREGVLVLHGLSFDRTLRHVLVNDIALIKPLVSSMVRSLLINKRTMDSNGPSMVRRHNMDIFSSYRINFPRQ